MTDKTQYNMPQGEVEEGMSVEALFAGIGELVEGEMAVHREDLLCLKDVGDVLKTRYGAMNDRCANLQESLLEMLRDYQQLQPYFAQIDSLEMYAFFSPCVFVL